MTDFKKWYNSLTVSDREQYHEYLRQKFARETEVRLYGEVGLSEIEKKIRLKKWAKQEGERIANEDRIMGWSMWDSGWVQNFLKNRFNDSDNWNEFISNLRELKPLFDAWGISKKANKYLLTLKNSKP